LICAVKGDPEDAFKKTVEIDRMIDALRDANPRQVRKHVICIVKMLCFCSIILNKLSFVLLLLLPFSLNRLRRLLLKISLLLMRFFG